MGPWIDRKDETRLIARKGETPLIARKDETPLVARKGETPLYSFKRYCVKILSLKLKHWLLTQIKATIKHRALWTVVLHTTSNLAKKNLAEKKPFQSRSKNFFLDLKTDETLTLIPKKKKKTK